MSNSEHFIAAGRKFRDAEVRLDRMDAAYKIAYAQDSANAVDAIAPLITAKNIAHDDLLTLAMELED